MSFVSIICKTIQLNKTYGSDEEFTRALDEYLMIPNQNFVKADYLLLKVVYFESMIQKGFIKYFNI